MACTGGATAGAAAAAAKERAGAVMVLFVVAVLGRRGARAHLCAKLHAWYLRALQR